MTCLNAVGVLLIHVLAWALWKERKDSMRRTVEAHYPMLRFRGPVTVVLRGSK